MSNRSGFPQDQLYTPTIRQYLRRLDQDRDGTLTDLTGINNSILVINGQITGIEAGIIELEEADSVLSGRVTSTEQAIVNLQIEDQSHDSEIAGLHAKDQSHDSEIAGLQNQVNIIQNDLDGAEQDIDTIQEDVASITGDIDNIATDIALITDDANLIRNDITALQWNSAEQTNNINVLDVRVTELSTRVGEAGEDYVATLSESVTGIIPKIVAALQLPAGTYLAPHANIGCPTSAAQATLEVALLDSTILATLERSGSMDWVEADAGFTLTDTTNLELLLVAGNSSATAIVKGFRIQRN